MSKKAIQPGQLVRASRAVYHGVRFGAVGRVLEVESGDALVQAPIIAGEGWSRTQWVDLTDLKLAKQATKRGAV